MKKLLLILSIGLVCNVFAFDIGSILKKKCSGYIWQESLQCYAYPNLRVQGKPVCACWDE